METIFCKQNNIKKHFNKHKTLHNRINSIYNQDCTLTQLKHDIHRLIDFDTINNFKTGRVGKGEFHPQTFSQNRT